MQETTTPPVERNSRITRKNLLSSLLIGFLLGVFAGAPIGWVVHQFYARQRAAQVLLCRQQNFGLTEVDLEVRCGRLY